MKKILISDSVDSKAVSVLEQAGFAVDYKPGLSAEDIKKVIGEYSGLVVRSATKVTPELIDLMENMEIIGRAGAGVDNINLPASTRKGIIVMNTPGGNTISTAEHAFSMMLSMCRRIPQADASMKAKKWDKKSFQGTEVYGKTLGVFGLGKIGREVATRALAFKMEVIAYDPLLPEEQAQKLNVTLVDKDTLFKNADIITIHVPLDEKTKNLVSAETLALCKDGVKIINCARGGIVNEADLVVALNSGKVSGAALDVFEVEPPDFSNEILSHPKVVTTPHLGASTDEAQEKVAIQVAEQMVDYFKNGVLYGAVNATSLEAFSNKELAPFIGLAESMGSLHAQLMQGNVRSITLDFYGELLGTSQETITAAFLLGFLTKSSSDIVNLVNAPFLAKELGIKLEKRRPAAESSYTNLLSISVITENGTKLIAGAVFGSTEHRIVMIDDFRVEFNPEGNIIIYSNVDKPGMLASVGSILAENSINIASLSLGRKLDKDEALTIVNLDSEPSDVIIGKISSLNGIKKVFSVKI